MDKLVIPALQEQLLVQGIGVLGYRSARLVEVLLVGGIGIELLAGFLPLGEPEQGIVLHIFELDLGYATLDDPLPEHIHMTLQQGERVDQQVVAGADQVHVQQDMVPHQAVHSLIVGDGVPGLEGDDDLLGRLPRDHALGLAEIEYVAGLGEELELGLQLGAVGDC